MTNIGVAAHITAASPGGPRYDAGITPEMRSDISNGIWLCQNHAKLIDVDEVRFPTSVLREWKETAEHMAALEARGFAVRRASRFPDLEKKAPKLINEMREDLKGRPLTRQFILIPKRATYMYGPTPCFTYYFDDHDDLLSVMTIMEHERAIYSIKFNSVDRYNFNEPFVEYLLGS